jgi:glucose repression regulatory protein TUP1
MVPPTANRLVELLDTVKNEYDQLAQEVMAFKNQRDEYEHKGKKTSMDMYTQPRSQHLSLYCSQ